MKSLSKVKENQLVLGVSKQTNKKRFERIQKNLAKRLPKRQQNVLYFNVLPQLLGLVKKPPPSLTKIYLITKGGRVQCSIGSMSESAN